MTKNKYYAYYLPEDQISGIVDSWNECERLVKGHPNAKYKGFRTRKEAQLWLDADADYAKKRMILPKLEPGIYFDAGTGRGRGVEASVTDETGKSLLDQVLPPSHINRHGKHWIFDDVTNNYGELLACKYALQIANKLEVKKVFGDSKLVIDSWSQWKIRSGVDEKTRRLAKEVSALRRDFGQRGGSIKHISGYDNPADLGFHRT